MPGPFAYLNNIPQPTDQLSVSQGQLLTNFASIKSLIDIDHVDFASVDAGKHAKVTFPVQNPAPTITYPDIGFYSFLNPDTAVNELYFANSNNITAAVPMTAANYQTNNGWTYLPSGIILAWGSYTYNTPGGVGQLINLPTITSGNLFSTVLNIQLSIGPRVGGAGDFDAVVRIANTTFPITTSSGNSFNVVVNNITTNTQVMWFATGY